MPRIAKADVNAALLLAANTIVKAGGSDGRTSRAEMKKALTGLPPAQRNLADIFFKFVDKRDFKTGAQVTAKDVTRAVAYAKEHMVAKYDLNNNGLSAAEIKKMSLTGKSAVDLAKALKAAPVTTLSVVELGRQATTVAKDASWMSESDSTPAFATGKPANASGVTVDNLKAAFGPLLSQVFASGSDDEVKTTADMAFEIKNAADSKSFLTDLGVPREDGEDAPSAKAFANLTQLLGDNLTDLRVVKVGPKDAAGSLAKDHGMYEYLLVGKAADGQLAGVHFTSIET